jgi:hypothetical protein
MIWGLGNSLLNCRITKVKGKVYLIMKIYGIRVCDTLFYKALPLGRDTKKL